MRRYVIAEKVGRKIRIQRHKFGITQEELADKTGLHVSTIGRIERGEINTPLQTLNKIAGALKLNPKELFF
jgi:transcriptional regulator with XRE-family HTH domain